MKKTKRTTITVETERLLTISRRINRLAWCPGCGRESHLLTVDEAAAQAHLGALAVYRLVEAGRLHYAETPAGTLLICAASLDDFISTLNG